MRHNVILEGWGCRLRPETKQDNHFVVDLWNQPYVQGQLVMSPLSYEGHMSYFKKYLVTKGSYFWIIENILGKPLGTLGIDSINAERCVIGRLAMYPTTEFLVITPLYLMYQFIFETLSLKMIDFTVLTGNIKVQKLHKMMGSVYTGENITKEASSGERIELQKYSLSSDIWFSTTRKLNRLLL